MSVLFLLALALLALVMKWTARLRPTATPSEPSLMAWILPSPSSAARRLSATPLHAALRRFVLISGALTASYWIYWHLVRAFHLRGFVLGYLGAPILIMVGEFFVNLLSALFLHGGRWLPALHHRPWFAKSVADFWGNRWNLWFSDWFRYAIFSRFGNRPVFAMYLVFAVSGLMHEWVINVPLYLLTGKVLFGTMMIYFLAQAAGIQLERRFLRTRRSLRVAWAWLVVFGPAPLVLNEGLLRTLHLWP